MISREKKLTVEEKKKEKKKLQKNQVDKTKNLTKKIK